jgi:deferrochelatase/peroxidase EfeB
MTRLDKTRYKLDSFLDDVQNIILTGAQPKNYNLFLDMSKDRFIGIKRFLPKTSSKFNFESIFKH